MRMCFIDSKNVTQLTTHPMVHPGRQGGPSSGSVLPLIFWEFGKILPLNPSFSLKLPENSALHI